MNQVPTNYELTEETALKKQFMDQSSWNYDGNFTSWRHTLLKFAGEVEIRQLSEFCYKPLPQGLDRLADYKLPEVSTLEEAKEAAWTYLWQVKIQSEKDQPEARQDFDFGDDK